MWSKGIKLKIHRKGRKGGPKKGIKREPYNKSISNGPRILHDGKPVKCPECKNNRIIKIGVVTRQDGEKVQRYKCTECSRKFILKSTRKIKPIEELSTEEKEELEQKRHYPENPYGDVDPADVPEGMEGNVEE